METNVADLLSRAALAEADRIAVCEASTGRTLTWSALDDLVDRVATGVAAAGTDLGDRVMIATGNRLEFVAAYLGTVRARRIAVPVNPRGTGTEYAHMIEAAGPSLIIADELTVGTVRSVHSVRTSTAAAAGEAAPALVTIGVAADRAGGEQEWSDLTAVSEPPQVGGTDADETAVLLFTSGTSGQARAAMLSHRALCANISQVAAVDPPMVTSNDVVLGVLPLFHIYGLNAVLGQALRQHARLVLVDGFDPEGTLDIIEDEAITVLPVAPPVFAHWMQIPSLEDRLGPVRLAFSGSAPIAPELVHAFTARTGVVIHQGYGLTEAAPVVSSTLTDGTRADRAPDPRSVGHPVPGVEVRIIDEDGQDAGHDPGEIHIRGANLFSGYWPEGEDGPDEEGWWATGDVGLLDAGELFLVDRIKELVIVSGFNVYPTEVEEVITAVDGVAQAAVIGVPDDATGEAVRAVVEADDQITDTGDLIARIEEYCAANLARFKRPSRIDVVDDLPSTVTGKVKRGQLREAARRRALGVLE